MKKVTNQKNAYIDVNPAIVTSDYRLVLAKRTQTIVGGGKWHHPRGHLEIAFDHNQTVEHAFAMLKTRGSATKVMLRKAITGRRALRC